MMRAFPPRTQGAGMAVRIDVVYEGDLQCTVTHPSGDRIVTDAPLDNEGQGRHFSPTDLSAASIGSCMLTVMGIVARRHGLDIAGSLAVVDKVMGATPRRHIARLVVRITLPSRLAEAERKLLEDTARACPVTASLGASTEIDLGFEYL